MRIPVLYILSSGRSGSTLLDMLLGLHPAVWTLGEAQILPWELRENRRPCGCGQPLSECPFWAPLVPHIPVGQGRYPIEYFRERHTGGKVLRWSRLWDWFRPTPGIDVAIDEYGALNAAYLRAVWDRANEVSEHPVQWVVDASKDPYRLTWLERSDYFDVRVIHLVKDPRAFSYSMTKDAPDHLRRNIRFGGRWLVENLHYGALCRHLFGTNRARRILYEEMAQRPDVTIRGIFDWLGLSPAPASATAFRNVRNHAISGNPMRWRQTEIRLDEKWRSHLPVRSSEIVWLMTSPLARRYGYRKALA